MEHYHDALGFRINYQQENMAVMDRDEVTLLLVPRTPRHTGIARAGFYIRNADELYEALRSRGADARGEPVSYALGLRIFEAVDLDGNELQFAQPCE